MEEAKSSPVPSASDVLQKHTRHFDDAEAASSSLRSSGGATEMVSNLIEGLVGGGGGAGGEDDASMKHRKERNPYDQRLPKMTGKSNGVPYKGFDHKDPLAPEETRAGPFAGLRYRLRGFFSPRATDIQQLLIKLQTQFDTLEVEHKKYLLMRDGSSECMISVYLFVLICWQRNLTMNCNCVCILQRVGRPKPCSERQKGGYG